MGIKIVDLDIALAAFQHLVDHHVDLDDAAGNGHVKALSVTFNRDGHVRSLFPAHMLLGAGHAQF